MSLYEVGRRGELNLTFGRRENQTILLENYSRPPLQVMRAIPDKAGCLCVYLLSPTGGVVQNDQYIVQICLSAQTHALITTPAATRVYRMPDGHAEQQISITVGEGAVLEFVPDTTILFADSDFRQVIDIQLQAGALLILHDMLMPGRLARQEKLRFRQYKSRLTVRDDAGMILYDNAILTPAQQNLTEMGVLEAFTCWGSFYVLGALTEKRLDIQSFCSTHQAVLNSPESLGALTPLYRNGVAARMLSARAEPITHAFEDLRLAVRRTLCLPDQKLRR